MKIKVRKLKPEAKLPQRAHQTDLCWDLFAAESIEISGGKTEIVSTGLAMKPPTGYGIVIEERSGLALKGVMIGGGVIDEGYRGDVGVIIRLLGFSNHRTINVGDKIAQMRLVKRFDAEIIDVDALDDTDRGNSGFGSTG